MMRFVWKGIDGAGKTHKGSCESSSKEDVTKQLLERGIAVLSISERQYAWWRRIQALFAPRAISDQQLHNFFDQLALMLDHGTELVQALVIIEKTSSARALRLFIQSIIKQLHEGKTFAQALAEQPYALPSFICPLVAVGEKSGDLKRIALHVSKLLGQTLHIRSLVQKAALTPLITLFFALFIVLSVVIFLVPHFQDLYRSFGQKPPASSQFLFTISSFLNQHWLGICLACIVLLVFWVPLLHLYKRRPFVSLLFSGMVMRIPILSTVTINKEVGIFSSIIAMYLASGLHLVKAIEQCQKTTKNAQFKAFLARLIKSLHEGKSLAEGLQGAQSSFVGPHIICLVETGEESGTLAQTFEKLSLYYNRMLDDTVNTLASIISPLFISIVGLIIAGMMAALYLPLFSVGSLFTF